MLEMTKLVLQRVSFDSHLFKKELLKALKWLKKEEAIALQAWCIATFGNEFAALFSQKPLEASSSLDQLLKQKPRRRGRK